MEKNSYEFAKDGNSDIYTMDLDTRVVERITDHSSIDTSPSFSQMENLLRLILIEVAYNNCGCEATVVVLRELLWKWNLWNTCLVA